MYTNVSNLPDRVREYLDGLGCPVRLLDGNAGEMQPATSWRGAAGANGRSLRECETDGITVLAYAMDAVNPRDPFVYMADLPADLSTTDGPVVGWDREWSKCNAAHADATPEQTFRAGGEVYARIAERTVWIAFPLQNLPDEADLDKILGVPIAACREIEATRRARETDAARQRFVEAAMNGSETQVQQLVRQTSDAEEAVRYHEQQHQTALATLRRNARELAAARLAAESDEGEEHWVAQWNALLEHPKVVAVTTDHNGDLAIETVGLTIRCEETRRETYLGRFQVVLPIASTGRWPRLNNLDNARGGRDHPHVTGGNPCWGGSEYIVGELRSSNEIAGLFEHALQYLEGYNPRDSWGAYIDEWMGSGAYSEASGDASDALSEDELSTNPGGCGRCGRTGVAHNNDCCGEPTCNVCH